MKRGLNVYPYCGSDPVNHADPTGEIANVLISGIEGGLIGLAAGFAGSAGSLLEQAISGERMNAGRGICALQDIFGGGLGIRKAYGYRYEMRDPDQPVRDGFDLGDFVRRTLIGGLMGGLSGVAFYGMDKAVKALEGSLSGGSKGGIAVKYSPVNPGPLEEELANTFSGATYTKRVLTEDTVMYRVSGGNAREVGSYMSMTPQNGGLQS